MGPAVILGHSVSHSIPYGYYASDAFQHQTRTESIKDMGNFRHEAPYISKGLENIVGSYPPVIYHLAVIFSHLSGLEAYDSIYFIVLVFPLIGILLIYLLISQINAGVATLSLPVMALIYATPPAMGFLYGHWPSLLSQVFLIGFFWCISNIDMVKSAFLIVVFFSSILMTHTSEAVFAVIAVLFYMAAWMLAGKLSSRKIKTIVLSVLASILICAYYLVIFMQTFGQGQAYTFTVEPVWGGNPGFYIAGFGLILIPIVIGIAVSIFRIKNLYAAAILGLFALAGGFMNYVGFTFRSFQIRFFWPAYLAVFFGIGVYFTFQFIFKNGMKIFSFVAAILVCVMVFGFFEVKGVPHLDLVEHQGIMDQYHWDALKWLGDKTEENSKVYFLYGDIYSQDALLRNAKRFHAQVDQDYFSAYIQNRTVRRYMMTEVPGDSGSGLRYRDGILRLKSTSEEMQKDFYKEWDICLFDYFVIDKASRSETLARYNIIIGSKLLEKGAQKAYENDWVVILKNNAPGGDCIDEGKF